MAFTDTKLSYFHSFSKMPAQNSTTLGNAINKSGHTVTASEVWAQDIPYYGKMGSLDDVKSKVQPYARKNDMCYITAGADKGKTFQYDGDGNWTDITSTLIDGALIKNANDDVVLLYHKGQTLTNLTADNNANTDSANNAARLWAKRDTEGVTIANSGTRLIEQFVAPTDKALNGLASVAYAPVIANGSLISGTNYYDYCFSGTILWASARTIATLIDCFEYVGEKVSDVVDTVSTQGTTLQTVKDQVDTISDALGLGSEVVGTTLGSRVTDNETALRTLLGLEDNAKVVATESISTTATTVATNVITTDLATNGNIAQAIATAKQGAIDSANGYTDGEISTAKASIKEVTDALAGRIAALEGVKLSVQVVDALPDTPVINTIYLVPEEGSTTGTYVEYIAYKPEGSETVTTERIGTTAVDLEGYTTDAEHSALADRVTALDAATTGRVAVVEDKVNTLEETTVPALDARLSTAEGNITTLQGQVDALTTGDTSVDSKIAAAKTELSNKSLASTSTGSTLVTVTTSGTVGSGMTTTVDTAALTTAIDTAKSGAIAAAKTETETQVGELDTKLSGQISALGQIIESNKTETDKTTDALAADVETLKQAMGETEDGTSIIDAITDIKSTLATTTATANSAAQSAVGDTYVNASQSGTKITVSTQIDAIDSKLAEEASVVGGAIKAAKQAGDAASQALETAKTQSLAKTGTLTGMFSVETTGTVGTGLESITITDAGLSQAISNAKSGAITETLASTITTAVGKDNQTTPKVTVTLSGSVQTPVLEVVTNDIASAQELAQLKQSVTDKNVSTTSAAQAVGVTATGNSIDVATASYAPATADAAGTWSNEAKLVTGTDVKEAIADINSKIDTLHGSAVTYKVFATLPTAAAEFKGVVALVPANTGDSAVAGSYVQYLCVETVSGDNKTYAWQRIGTTAADFTQYAKSVTINGSKVSTASATGDINLGTVITGIENTSGTENSTILQGSITNGKLTLGIASASTNGKGAVQLASTHDASDTAKAATGSTVAAAISGIAETNASDNGVKVTTAGGSVTGVEVTTTSIVSEGALVESVTGDNLITAADALAAVKLAAPANYITSINNSTGAKAFTIKDGRETVYENDLWGTSVTTDGETITVDHKYLSNPNANQYSAWLENVTAVQYNKAYAEIITGSEGKFTGVVEDSVVANIQTEMIKDGSYMFYNTSLTSFSGDLSSLVNGDSMFQSTSLTSFSGDLSSLEDGKSMFYNTSLASFSGDLSSLTTGEYMFYNTSLTSFTSDLSSLVDGSYMFYNTPLDTESVECIADTIRNVTDLSVPSDIIGSDSETYTVTKRIDIGIANDTPNEAENAAFWTMQNDKGWSVYVNGSQYNPTEPTAIATLDENGEEVTTPIPFWAKPVETDEEHAEYVGEDGKFYNVVGGQFIYVSDPETYGQFTSLADAVANMRLTKYEKPQEEA